MEFFATFDADDRPKTIYISGLQPNAEDVIAIPYLQALYDELDRICTMHDLLILNDSDTLVRGIDDADIHPHVALHKRGFTMQRCYPKNKVQVFERK